MHPYIPHTQEDIDIMLHKIGVESVEALFSDISTSAILNTPLDLPDTHSEREIIQKLTDISMKNIDTTNWLNFAGGGIYEHLIPSIIPALLSRSEFYTAYTPYQPEISQGTLQAIFEYQTMMTELTGLEVANASHYDGSTALAEAAFMSCSATRRGSVLVADTISVEAKKVLQTYLKYKDLNIIMVESTSGTIDHRQLKSYLTDDIAAYIVSTPNYYGLLEDLTDISDLLHSNKSHLIIMNNPMSLSLYKSPAEWGADIAVGDGQVFGNAMNFGGPTLGYIACTKKLMRKMPGRIVGETVDIEGKRGYVLTLQAREQHIRREKATSNITSNQALNALAATIYLSALGNKGITEVANRSRINAHYLRERLKAIKGIHLVYSGDIYNEFVIQVSNVKDFYKKMASYQIIPGVIINEQKQELLISSTEIHSKKDLDTYIDAIVEVMS